jgi:peroxiredoxin
VIGRFGVTGFPETFVIDREGRVVEFFAGAVNGEEERARLDSAIEDATT